MPFVLYVNNKNCYILCFHRGIMTFDCLNLFFGHGNFIFLGKSILFHFFCYNIHKNLYLLVSGYVF